MNLVAAGVDFTAGYFDLASLDTVFVQGHLTVPAADSHLVKGYVLLGGNLDGTVVVRQFDIVAAGEVLDVAGLNLLHRLAINLAFPAAVGRILHLFIQVVQGIHHIVVFLVPDIFADLGYISQIRSLGNVVDGDILHLVRMHLILDMEFHLIVIGNLVVPGVVPFLVLFSHQLEVGIVLLQVTYIVSHLFQLFFRGGPALGSKVLCVDGPVGEAAEGAVVAVDSHRLVTAGTITDGHRPAIAINNYRISISIYLR